MLKHGEINPLNVMGIRRLEHCPPHFERVEFDIKVQEKHIADWIWENLGGRFWIGDTYRKENTNIIMQKCVAFELPAEASYFALFLDRVNAYSYDIT